MVKIDATRATAALRTWVQKKGITQSKLAIATGVHQSQVSRILSGRAVRLSKNLQQLCKYAKIPLHAQQSSAPLPELERAVRDLVAAGEVTEAELLYFLKAGARLLRWRRNLR